MEKYGESGMNLGLVWNVAVTDLPPGALDNVPDTTLGHGKQKLKLGRLPAQLDPSVSLNVLCELL